MEEALEILCSQPYKVSTDTIIYNFEGRSYIDETEFIKLMSEYVYLWNSAFRMANHIIHKEANT